MPYPFLGSYPLTYTQYLDADSGGVLVAEPGQSYDMRPVPGAQEGLTVPPGDGQWGEEEDKPAKTAKTKAAPAAKGD